jgi:hypothetical protein
MEGFSAYVVGPDFEGRRGATLALGE